MHQFGLGQGIGEQALDQRRHAGCLVDAELLSGDGRQIRCQGAGVRDLRRHRLLPAQHRGENEQWLPRPATVQALLADAGSLGYRFHGQRAVADLGQQRARGRDDRFIDGLRTRASQSGAGRHSQQDTRRASRMSRSPEPCVRGAPGATNYESVRPMPSLRRARISGTSPTMRRAQCSGEAWSSAGVNPMWRSAEEAASLTVCGHTKEACDEIT